MCLMSETSRHLRIISVSFFFSNLKKIIIKHSQVFYSYLIYIIVLCLTVLDICMSCVLLNICSEYHSLITTYTGIHGRMIEGTPEFSAVTTLDDHQIDYYDSNIEKLIPRQDWMKDYTSTEMWKEDTRSEKMYSRSTETTFLF